MKPIEIRGHLLLAGTNATEISRQLGVSRQAVHQTINNLNASPRIRLAIVQAIGKQVLEIWPNTKTQSILPENKDVEQALRQQRPELPSHEEGMK